MEICQTADVDSVRENWIYILQKLSGYLVTDLDILGHLNWLCRLHYCRLFLQIRLTCKSEFTVINCR